MTDPAPIPAAEFRARVAATIEAKAAEVAAALAKPEPHRFDPPPGLAAEFFAGVPTRDLAVRYGTNPWAIHRYMRTVATEDQLHEVWKKHQRRREAANRSRRRSRKLMAQVEAWRKMESQDRSSA